METCNPGKEKPETVWKPRTQGPSTGLVGWFNLILGSVGQGAGSGLGERCWLEEGRIMQPSWEAGPPGPGLSAILNWRWFWHHGALPGGHCFALTSTNTSAFPRRPSLLPKQWQAESRARGHNQPFLPHFLASPASRCLQRVSPGLCSQHCSPARLAENRRVHGLIPPPGARVAWGTPPPTATGVTGSLHHTALAENLLSRGLIFRQVTLQGSLCSAWGTSQQDTVSPGLDLLCLDLSLSFHL